MQDILKDQARLIREQQLQRFQRFEQITSESHNLDTVINFKVNSTVKAEFDSICKQSHSSISRELKLYMLHVIKHGKL
jgi:hypothetical protein